MHESPSSKPTLAVDFSFSYYAVSEQPSRRSTHKSLGGGAEHEEAKHTDENDERSIDMLRQATFVLKPALGPSLTLRTTDFNRKRWMDKLKQVQVEVFICRVLAQGGRKLVGNRILIWGKRKERKLRVKMGKQEDKAALVENLDQQKCTIEDFNPKNGQYLVHYDHGDIM